VLAIDFGGTKIAVAACRIADPAHAGGPAGAELPGAPAADTAEPEGMLVTSDVVETAPELGAEANLARGVELAVRLLGGERAAAVGACTFGIPREDGVALSPAIEGWDRLPLRRRLADAFGAPVAVDTDVKAAASAEVRHGALAGADPALYLNLGTGLAVALVAGGRVIRGAHGAAGEVGSSLLRVAGVNGAGGVLEDVVSGMGLARAVATRSHGPGRRTGADAGRVAALFESVGQDGSDPRLEAILDTFLEELCFHMVNLSVALDPQRIAVGGGLVRSWERIEGSLRAALDAHVPYPPQLVTGAYPFDAALRGAVDLGLELAGVSGTVAGLVPPTAFDGQAASAAGTGRTREDLVKTTKGGRQC
jgi:glucokinase